MDEHDERDRVVGSASDGSEFAPVTVTRPMGSGVNMPLADVADGVSGLDGSEGGPKGDFGALVAAGVGRATRAEVDAAPAFRSPSPPQAATATASSTSPVKELLLLTVPVPLRIMSPNDDPPETSMS